MADSLVYCVFSAELDPRTIDKNDFYIIDSRNILFSVSAAERLDDMLTVRLHVPFFQYAVGNCRAVYDPGSLVSMARENAIYSEYTFPITHIPDPPYPSPVLVSSENDGNVAILTFDQNVEFDITVRTESSFRTIIQVPDYVPDGPLHPEERFVEYVTVEGRKVYLHYPNGIHESLANAYGNAQVTYNGFGNLHGDGDFVLPFETSFPVTGLTPKPDQHPNEHLSVTGADTSFVLLHLQYYNAAEPSEHLAVTGVSASGTVTKVEDI